MQLSQKRKTFSNFFAVLECRLNFKLYEKKRIVIANIFPKLQTPKDAVK